MLRKMTSKIKHLRARFYIQRHEQVFQNGSRTIKYLYCPYKQSKSLAVIFSAFPAEGKSAGYNMVSTFSGTHVNRLYILDAFGYQKRGAYYLSENGDFFIPPLVSALVQKYREGMEQTVFLGSSKGGYAALYYGLLLGADKIIAGAPQYFIGGYLIEKPEHIPNMDAIAGNHSPDAVQQYNKILPELINTKQSNNNQEIIIHYSPAEPTYEKHIVHLIRDLSAKGFCVFEDTAEYENHSDVSRFFPKLCLEHINKMKS